LLNSAASVIVAENVGVFVAGFGHSDGARLAQTDAVAEAAARKYERARPAAGPALDVDHEHRRAQATEQLADAQLAAHAACATFTPQLDGARAPRNAALADRDLVHRADAQPGHQLIDLRRGLAQVPAVALAAHARAFAEGGRRRGQKVAHVAFRDGA